MEQKAISVSQLSGYIKGIFEAEELLHNIAVFGEVSGLSVLRGNAYFNLKDNDAILSCVFFGANEILLKNGDLIVATGTPKYYVKGGKLNFNVVRISPYGIGELFKRFLETKEKLELEGLFNLETKKQIPENVKRIGVVTSEKGAVIRDIINIRTRRNSGVDVVVYPSRVQGGGAEEEVIEGIKYFDTQSDVDVIIVARGGGSFEDLAPFNNEKLARVVFNTTKPVVSAVGHETDFTIIDFVSDLRAPTPSAAAELVIRQKSDVVGNIVSCFTKLNSAVSRKVNIKYSYALNLKRDLNNSIKNAINFLEYNLGMKIQVIEKLNPTKILERGYAKIEKDKSNVSSVLQVKEKDVLEIFLKDGKLLTEVKGVEANGKRHDV